MEIYWDSMPFSDFNHPESIFIHKYQFDCKYWTIFILTISGYSKTRPKKTNKKKRSDCRWLTQSILSFFFFFSPFYLYISLDLYTFTSFPFATVLKICLNRWDVRVLRGLRPLKRSSQWALKRLSKSTSTTAKKIILTWNQIKCIFPVWFNKFLCFNV